ncbi:MAG: C13 family peptidase [Desulfococcaceae bacterium]
MGYKPNNFNNNFNNNSNPYCNPSPVEPHFVGEDIESGVFPKATEAPEAPEYNPDTNLTAFADPSKKWVANQWAGALLDFGENMRFRIYGNDAEKIYVQGNLPVTGLFTENQDQAYTIDDLHLKADSPLIDAGVYAGFNLHDFEDDARPQSGGYDIGADEYARIIVTPSELTVSEPDGTATFTIRLKSEPASDVYIPVNSTFPAEAAASPFSVTLDKTNWNTGVTVTVTAEDDTILDGTQTCTIVTGSAVSADPLYNAYNPGDVTVNITDDEKPSLSIRYVLPNLGTVGQDMTVSVIGNGFDNTVTIAIKKEGGIETPVTQFTVSGLTKIDNMVIPAQSETGQYNLIIRRDGQEVELEGAVTFEESEIVEKQKKQKAIIVAGGGPYPGNVLWNATRTCTYKAYSSLLSQGYSDANIFYLTPEAFADINGDGVNDTDRIPTLANLKENLEYAIETWAADAEDLILYISDHGSEDELVLNKVSYQEEKLSVSQLDAMLDTLQAKIPGKVIFIYDACMSGSFLADMLPPDGEKRYVLTSTSEDEPAWFLDNGRYSFSYHFWHSVYLTGRLYISFETAKNMVSSDQTPRIDLNQDGSPDEITTDHLDNDILIGRGRVAASDLPIVVKESVHVLPNLLNCETSATIRADSVTAKYTVSTVWARITPPDFGSGSSFPVTELPREKLLKTGNGSYEGIYNQFLLPGSYKISVYAIDNNGDSSLFVEKLLTKKCEKGDINNDTETDLKDAIIALKILAGADVSGYFRTDYNTGVVDVNGNAKVEMAEAVFILQKVAGLR